jgi:hypothetical protein
VHSLATGSPYPQGMHVLATDRSGEYTFWPRARCTGNALFSRRAAHSQGVHLLAKDPRARSELFSQRPPAVSALFRQAPARRESAHFSHKPVPLARRKLFSHKTAPPGKSSLFSQGPPVGSALLNGAEASLGEPTIHREASLRDVESTYTDIPGNVCEDPHNCDSLAHV